MSTPPPAVDLNIATLGGQARTHGLKLLHTARRDGWNVDLVEAALNALACEADRWKDAWAHVKVTGEQEVRRASARALDCDAHGHLIHGLEQQLTAISNTYRSAEHSRRAHVMAIARLTDAIDRIRKRITDGDTDGIPDLPAFLDTLAGYLNDVQKEARWRP